MSNVRIKLAWDDGEIKYVKTCSRGNSIPLRTVPYMQRIEISFGELVDTTGIWFLLDGVGGYVHRPTQDIVEWNP